jgi:hypothetical protein
MVGEMSANAAMPPEGGIESKGVGWEGVRVVSKKFLSDKAEKTNADSSLTTPKLNYVWGPARSE